MGSGQLAVSRRLARAEIRLEQGVLERNVPAVTPVGVFEHNVPAVTPAGTRGSAADNEERQKLTVKMTADNEERQKLTVKMTAVTPARGPAAAAGPAVGAQLRAASR